MSATRTSWSRLGTWLGLALATAVGAWWIGAVWLALQRGLSAEAASQSALAAGWLARGLVLPFLAVRAACLSGWRAGATAGLSFIAPTWPVAALAWSATRWPASGTLVVELGLLAAAAGLAWIGAGLRRWRPTARAVEPAGVVIAAAAAALWWVLGPQLVRWSG